MTKKINALGTFSAMLAALAMAGCTIQPAGGVAENAPPAVPQRDEVVINGWKDAVALHCTEREQNVWNQLNLKPVRIVVTRAPKYGTVWRADVAFPGDAHEADLWRSICWANGTAERPLERIDTGNSIPRLK